MHEIAYLFSAAVFVAIFLRSFSKGRRRAIDTSIINDSASGPDVTESDATCSGRPSRYANDVQDLGGIPSRIEFPGWAVPKKK